MIFLLAVISFYQDNRIDLFVSLSESEGLPVSMMEAMNHGIPVVSKDVGGVREIVIDGETGFIVPKESSLEEIAKSINEALSRSWKIEEISSFVHT